MRSELRVSDGSGRLKRPVFAHFPLFLEISMRTFATVQAIVTHAMKEQKLNQSTGALRCDVTRDFFRRLVKGEVNCVREGHVLADKDPRYLKVAKGLGITPEAFISLAEREQRTRLRLPQREDEKDVETGIGRTPYGGLIVTLSPQTLAMRNVALAFDIPEGRITITIQSPPTTNP